jgi:general stress protein 26
VAVETPPLFLRVIKRFMGDVKDLANTQAIEKLKELAEDIRICMFCTKTADIPFDTRPMGTQTVDDEGNFWFFSAAGSHKNFEIKENEQVQLIYSKVSDSHFLSVSGRATVSRDRKKIDELWNKMAEAWFKGGKDDPELTLICVKPDHAYYWDTLYGKMITLLKIAISAVSGKQMDGGVEGKLKL